MPLMAFVSAKIATKSQYCKFFLKEYIAQSMINWLRSLNSNLSSDHKMYSFYYYGMFPDIIYFFGIAALCTVDTSMIWFFRNMEW